MRDQTRGGDQFQVTIEVRPGPEPVDEKELRHAAEDVLELVRSGGVQGLVVTIDSADNAVRLKFVVRTDSVGVLHDEASRIAQVILDRFPFMYMGSQTRPVELSEAAVAVT